MQAKSTRGVQWAEMAAAADAILAEGEKPTIERVRLKLGRGSPNTLGPMLDTWYQGLAARVGLTGPGGAGVPPAARAAFEGLWLAAVDLASSAANESVEAQRTALSDRETGLVAQEAKLKAGREALEAKEAALAASLAELKHQLEGRAADLVRAQGELDVARSEITTARAVISRLTVDHEAERTRLARLFEEQLKANKSQQEASAASERRLLEEVDRARQLAKQAQGALTKAESGQAAERQGHVKQADALQDKIRSLELQLATVTGQLTAAKVQSKRSAPVKSPTRRLKAKQT